MKEKLLSELKLFHTNSFECGYFKDLEATYIILDPEISPDIKLQEVMAEKGYRRSAENIYFPWCHNCNKCIPLRLKLKDFQLGRSQRRCLKKNQSLKTTITKPKVTPEIFNLYKQYQIWKHPNAGMDDCQNIGCMDFLQARWSHTQFAVMRHQQTVVGVTVFDRFNQSLSAVYTFYDKKQASRSLGTFSVLWQIQYAQSIKLKYLYLGFYIKDSPKMSYKTNFKPYELLLDKKWIKHSHSSQ